MSDQKGKPMGTHLSEEQIRMYAGKLLETQELLKVDQHLSECQECRERLPMSFSSIGDSLSEEFMETNEEHLSYDQIVHYMENQEATNREQIAMHLKICSRCAGELNDLKAYAREYEVQPVRKFLSYRFFAVAAVIAILAIAAALHFQQREPQETTVVQPVRTIVSLADRGTRITLDERGNLRGLEGVPDEYQTMVLGAIQNRIVETPAPLQALIGKDGTLRGDELPNSFRVLSPVGTIVADESPLFRWEVLPGTSKYRVTIMDEQLNLIAESAWIQDTSWKPEKPLPRDRTYIWQVAASRNDLEVVSPQPPARDARFHILNQKAFEQLKMETEQYQRSNLLLGLLYARYGVLDVAEKHLHLVADANPESTEIKQLLESLQKLRS